MPIKLPVAIHAADILDALADYLEDELELVPDANGNLSLWTHQADRNEATDPFAVMTITTADDAGIVPAVAFQIMCRGNDAAATIRFAERFANVLRGSRPRGQGLLNVELPGVAASERPAFRIAAIRNIRGPQSIGIDADTHEQMVSINAEIVGHAAGAA